MVYRLSRSLYRELAPLLASARSARGEREQRARLLDACEVAMRRLVAQPRLYARPARSLFREIRHLFPVEAQASVWNAVSAHVEAGRTVATRAEEVRRRQCDAFTRRGTPCPREPRPGHRFCPSHRHLEAAPTADAA